MAYKRLRSHDLRLGLRVEYRSGLEKRRGMVASDRLNYSQQYEVFPEGCSTARPEFWPLRHSYALPQERQLPSLGGAFEPPKGYPFFPLKP